MGTLRITPHKMLFFQEVLAASNLIAFSRRMLRKGKIEKEKAFELYSITEKNKDFMNTSPFAEMKEHSKRMEGCEVNGDELEALYNSMHEVNACTSFVHTIADYYNIPRSELFYDNPVPEITFEGKTFVFTGVFSIIKLSTAEDCIHKIGDGLGSLSYGLGYLVVGSLPKKSWRYDNFGSKIETIISKKIQLLKFGGPDEDMRIIREVDFVKALLKHKKELGLYLNEELTCIQDKCQKACGLGGLFS